jgi:transposase InsO family protein
MTTLCSLPLFLICFQATRGLGSGKRDFDQLCAEFGINRRLSPPAHTQTDGMVQRFKGRVEEALQSPHFQWGQDLETTLHRYVPL